MPEFTYIYALRDPQTEEIRYVGKSNDPQKRLLGHLERCCMETCHKARWISKLVSNGLKPELVILEKVEKSIWEYRERMWIWGLRRLGFRLTNARDGGDGVFFDNVVIEKMRLAKIGTRASEETKAKMSNVRSGRKHNKEWCENISKGRTGVKLTVEQRKNIAAKNGRSKLSPCQVKDIRVLIQTGARKEDIAIEYGVCVETIYNIAKRKTYRFVE